MAKILRKTLKLFGGSGPSTSFGQFGSKRAGVPQTSQDPTILQQLTAWVNGFQDAISLGDKAPYLEDMNAVLFVHSYMMAYAFQMGIPEWDSGTTYFIGSVVQDAAGNGQWFRSLQDNNTGNAPPVGASNAWWQWVNPPVVAPPAVNNSLLTNLVVTTKVAAPTSKVDIAAGLLSVQGVVLTNVSLTADITITGANGLDTGVEAANSWYAIHVITNNDGSLVASLLSLSATAPTLPAGYTKFRRVAWVRNNSLSDFLKFRKYNEKMYYDDPASNGSVVSTSGSGTYVLTGTMSLATWIPPTSRAANLLINIGINGTNAPASTSHYATLDIRPDSVATLVNVANAIIAGPSEQIAVSNSMEADFPVSSGQSIDYSVTLISPTDGGGATVFVAGYTDPA